MDVYDGQQGFFPSIGPPPPNTEDMARIATAAPLATRDQLDLFCVEYQRRLQAIESARRQREHT